MNLLLLTYQGDMAGSTNSIFYLADGLARRGHAVYVGCRRESELFGRLADSPAVALPMTFRSKVDGQNMRQIRDAVRRYDIQLINAQSSKDRYTAILARWRYRLPVRLVLTRRQVPKSDGGRLQQWFYRWGTDGIVAVSEGVRRALVAQGQAPGHVTTIPNGTPAAKYAAVEPSRVAALRHRYGLRPTDRVVGCVARRKSQDQLLAALAELNLPTKVLLVGLPPQRDYAAAVEALAGRHEVIFTGRVDGLTALHHYPLFTAKVLPSTMEGLSQSLLEAMALGVPVLATDAAGNPDLVRDGKNGLLFPDGQPAALAAQLRRLLTDAPLRTRLTEAGRQTALIDFSIERTLDRYERYFEGLMARPA